MPPRLLFLKMKLNTCEHIVMLESSQEIIIGKTYLAGQPLNLCQVILGWFCIFVDCLDMLKPRTGVSCGCISVSFDVTCTKEREGKRKKTRKSKEPG